MSRNDVVNRTTMEASDTVRSYSTEEQLMPAERALVERVVDQVRGQPILDLGVGAGRTVSPLRAISRDYVAVDYSQAMVDASRKRFPDARIELGDARDLSRFPDDHFALVMFSCNGLGMVGHEDRLQVLAEVLRVLRPGGAFTFTTHNRASDDHDAGFRFPEFEVDMNPLRTAVRGLRFVRSTVTRLRNRRRHVPLEQRQGEYSIINDVFHDYGVMLYYIDVEAQRRQLERVGFAPGAFACDGEGRPVVGECRDGSIGILAKKPG